MQMFRLLFSLIVLLALPAVSFSQTQSADERSLGDIARELRSKKMQAPQSAPVNQSAQAAPQTATAVVPDDSAAIERVEDDARALLMREQFAALDTMSETLRSTKARLPGGAWKLSRLYDAISTPTNAQLATEADWSSHIALLKRWVAGRPQSITARVALASAYLEWAWSARGYGYANTVTEEGWRLFGERTEKAGKILIDASSLRQKCPHWYFIMQKVALASGADKDQLHAIFEKAVAFEPDYFGFYQLYAGALLPKWLGEPGDVEKFAKESYERIGGKRGAYIYFEIASNLCGRCGDFSPQGYSWKILKDGYAAMEKLYGLSPLKVNRFAYMAVSYGDTQTAAQAFQRIGDRWDPSVWGTRARFESQRQWAGVSATPSSPPQTTTPSPTALPVPSMRAESLLQLAAKAQQDSRWTDAAQFAKQAIELALPMPGTQAQLGHAYMIISECERNQGHIPEALSALDAAVAAVSQKTGSNSIETALILVQTSMEAGVLSDFDREERYLRRAIEIREKTNGSFDKELPNDITMLGNFCQMRGRTKEALELYQRAVAVGESFRHDDLMIAGALEGMGDLYQYMHRYDDAEVAFLRELHVYEGKWGMDSKALLPTLARLANLYRAMANPVNEQRIREKIEAIQANGTT